MNDAGSRELAGEADGDAAGVADDGCAPDVDGDADGDGAAFLAAASSYAADAAMS